MELVWYRMLGPLLGGSVFTFGLILSVALVGIGIGGLLYSLIGVNRRASLTGLATSCLLEAAAIALAFALGDRIAVLALVLMPLGQAAFGALIAGWTIVAVIVVLPAAIISGYQFPQLIALFGHGRNNVGRQIGLAYAANTVGAIAGSLAGGFLVLPLLSAPGAWRFAALCLVALGIAAAVLAMSVRLKADTTNDTTGDVAATGVVSGFSRTSTLKPLIAPALLAAATILLLTAVGPTAVWRHSGIASGTAGISTINSPQELRSWMHAQRSFVEWQADGFESSVALSVGSGGYAFVVNGKADGSARVDAGTQVMLALIGSILHPNPRHSLVIGLGTGSSAGWLGAVPSMERVDVVELEPIVLDIARQSRAVNQDVLNNPKVHVRIGDAREVLLTTSQTYRSASHPSLRIPSAPASRASSRRRVIPRRQRSADRRRPVPPVAPGVRRGRFGRPDRLRDDGVGVSVGRDLADPRRRHRAGRRQAHAGLRRRADCRPDPGRALQGGAARGVAVERPAGLSRPAIWRAIGSRARSGPRRASRSTPTIATSSNSASRGRSGAITRWSRRSGRSPIPLVRPGRQSMRRRSTGPPWTCRG